MIGSYPKSLVRVERSTQLCMSARRRTAKSFYTLLVLPQVSFFDPFEKKHWVSEALGVLVVQFRLKPPVSMRPYVLFGS